MAAEALAMVIGRRTEIAYIRASVGGYGHRPQLSIWWGIKKTLSQPSAPVSDQQTTREVHVYLPSLVVVVLYIQPYLSEFSASPARFPFFLFFSFLGVGGYKYLVL